MNEILGQEFYGNSILEWILLLSILLFGFFISKLFVNVVFSFFGTITSKTKSKLDDILFSSLKKPTAFGLYILSFWIATKFFTFSKFSNDFILNTLSVLVVLNITWFCVKIIDGLIVEYAQPYVLKTDNNLDDQLLPIFQKIIRLSIWIIGGTIALSSVGYDVGALITGLGIGGLAFAMAAKDSLSNFFGGITVLVDKPFKINDRIKINGFDGNVKEIGVRSTRLETLEGRMVTIPNAKFTDKEVENISQEPNRKVILNLGLTYDTSPENMELAIKLLNEISVANEFIEDKISVGFTDFGDFSLGITYIYYIKKGEDILGVKTAINLAILSTFNANKLSFAFPTQTLIHENTVS